MSTQHIVTAAAVKVSIGGAGGNRVGMILRHGAVVPAGVAEDQLERLVGLGLLDAVELEDDDETENDDEATDPADAVDEGPYKGLKVADLKEEIAERNEGRDEDAKIVPAAPGHRPELIAALIADDNAE